MEQLQNTWNIVCEHFMVLYDVFVASVGLNNNTEYYKLKSTGSDLDQSRLTDTRSAENDWIRADTDPQYRIDASLEDTRGEWSKRRQEEKTREREELRWEKIKQNWKRRDESTRQDWDETKREKDMNRMRQEVTKREREEMRSQDTRRNIVF